MTRRRIVFMGSPQFAVPALERLAEAHDVLAVYSQPPARAGRGMKTAPQPLARRAAELGIETRHPQDFRDEGDVLALAALEAELFIVVAYGLVLPRAVLDIPPLGCINGHASLLPRWRGAAPIQRAIEAGDTATGICAMLMEEGLDTGPVLARRECDMGSRENAGQLHDKLSLLNAELLCEVVAGLPGILGDATPQDDALACYAAKLTKGEAHIDWSESVADIDRCVRAFAPRPGAWFMAGAIRVRVIMADIESGDTKRSTSGPVPPGTYLGLDEAGGARVSTGAGVIILRELQPAGATRMTAGAYVNGRRLEAGDGIGDGAAR